MNRPDAPAEALDLAALDALRGSARDYALLDVREPAAAERGHIPGATTLPRRRIEWRIEELIPARATPIVVYADGGSDAARLAAATLRALGYRDTRWLAGGLQAWHAAGRPLASGVNVPSKRFGEMLLRHCRVPQVSADDLQAWRNAGLHVIVCDVRTPQEYRQGCVPGAISTPSPELALHVRELRRFDKVVVSCAGRTRGIVATQTLRELGLDQVFALENGTMGWLLAARVLEKGAQRQLEAADPRDIAQCERVMGEVAAQEGVGSITVPALRALLTDSSVNRYVIDVRQIDAFAAGHIAGTLALPGGQAVQRADDFVAVRDASIVFVDQREARALISAAWFKRMGFPKVAVLAGGIEAWCAHGFTLETGHTRRAPAGFEPVRRRVRWVTVRQLQRGLEATPPMLIDVETSARFNAGHLPGAQWLSRGVLEAGIGALAPARDAPLVLSSEDGRQAAYAADTLGALGYTEVAVLEGGTHAWRQAGLPLLPGSLRDTDDMLIAPYDKGRTGMLDYLNWERMLSSAAGETGHDGGDALC